MPIDLSAFCKDASCCAEDVCSTVEAKTKARDLRTSLEKSLSFEELVELRPTLGLLAADRKSAFAGLDQAADRRLRALADAQVASALRAGSVDEFPALVDRLATGARLDGRWVASQFALLGRQAEAAARVRAVPVVLPAAGEKASPPADLVTLRVLDARWRAIASTPASLRHSSSNPPVKVSLDKAVGSVDATLASSSTRYLGSLLAADRFLEAEGVIQEDAVRTPASWSLKAGEELSKRQATTTMGVDACVRGTSFEVCREALDRLTSICEGLEPLRVAHAGSRASFLEAARAAEQQRRSSSPASPEAFTCNTSARLKLAEALQRHWRMQSNEALDSAVQAMKLPYGRCDARLNSGWWDARYCEGLAAMGRSADAARALVRTRATQEIDGRARSSDYSEARRTRDRWSALLGPTWAAEMDRKIEATRRANEAAAAARAVAECRAACSRQIQKELSECSDEDDDCPELVEYVNQDCYSSCDL